MKTKYFSLLLSLFLGLPGIASAQVKSADDIVKDIQVEGRVSFAQKSLPFKLNSTELASADAKKQMAELAKALKSDALMALRLDITGFTCDLGTDAYNLDLSKRRAAAIKDLLVSAGISKDRLDTAGKGEADPAVPNDSEENRRQNRRVVLTPVKPVKP